MSDISSRRVRFRGAALPSISLLVLALTYAACGSRGDSADVLKDMDAGGEANVDFTNEGGSMTVPGASGSPGSGGAAGEMSGGAAGSDQNLAGAAPTPAGGRPGTGPGAPGNGRPENGNGNGNGGPGNGGPGNGGPGAGRPG